MLLSAYTHKSLSMALWLGFWLYPHWHRPSHFVLIYCLPYSLIQFEQIAPKDNFSQDYSNKNLYSIQSSLIVLFLVYSLAPYSWGLGVGFYVARRVSLLSLRRDLVAYIVARLSSGFHGFYKCHKCLKLSRLCDLYILANRSKMGFFAIYWARCGVFRLLVGVLSWRALFVALVGCFVLGWSFRLSGRPVGKFKA